VSKENLDVVGTFTDVVSALPYLNAGIWTDTDPNQEKMNSYLCPDIYTSPKYRENPDEAEEL
jgi:hypothetical protein